MRLPLCTAGGEIHGIINTLTNSVPNDDFKHFSPAHKEKLVKEKKEHSRIVKAEYMNSMGRHERLTKPYCKYAGDPIEIYHLIPGHVYELPFGMIEEVNDKSKHMKQRSGLLSVDGNDVNKGAPLENDQEGTWIHRLVPVGF